METDVGTCTHTSHFINIKWIFVIIFFFFRFLSHIPKGRLKIRLSCFILKMHIAFVSEPFQTILSILAEMIRMMNSL